ncbi:type II toxin-antitoxin system RelE/ParE family toxin [Candidatus Saccharibacteria bacterium]|nr:type II toxin-antitoxin system RelE/ParE family toxin [Candidatus Saccharibacteria bacterium]
MYNVIVSKKAYEDLDNIYKYIAFEKEDKFAARKNIDGINASLRSLKTFPLGYSVYELHPSFRVIHYKRYKILYRVNKAKKTVTIARVVHSLQNY